MDNVAGLPRRRLLVELNAAAWRQLNVLSELEGANKSTIVNRAVLLYELVSTAQREGATLYLQDTDGVTRRVRLVVGADSPEHPS